MEGSQTSRMGGFVKGATFKDDDLSMMALGGWFWVAVVCHRQESFGVTFSMKAFWEVFSVMVFLPI